MTTATAAAFTCTWCRTSDHAPSSIQPNFCTECVHATLQGRENERMAPAPSTPDLATRIILNRDDFGFDCFATVEGEEMYIGSKPNYFDGEALCREYRYHHYADNHTPEKAAAVAMEDTALDYDNEPGAMLSILGPVAEYPCDCGVTEPATMTGPITAVACPCGAPATITVRTRGTIYLLCNSCFERDFQHDMTRTGAWEVLARVPSAPLALTCEICHRPRTEAEFDQLRSSDAIVICDDCRRQAAVRHSGAESAVSDDTSYALYELALTDPAALRTFLAGHSLYQRERLAWRFASWLKREHGIERAPTLIARNWDNLIGSEEKSPAAA